MHIQEFDSFQNPFTINPIPVSNKVFGCTFKRKCLDKLKGGPFSCWVAGDIEVDHLATIQRQHHENIQGNEGDGRSSIKVDGRDFAQMALKESLPVLGWTSFSFDHVLGNSGFTDIDSEHDQLTMNAGSTQQWIVQGDLPGP